MNRKNQIREAFEKFHAENPHVFTMFTHFTFEMIRQGRTRYSAMAIMQRVRWEVDSQGEVSDDGFKVNNNHQPHYARLFMERYPKHDSFFETRELISDTRTVRKKGFAKVDVKPALPVELPTLEQSEMFGG